MRRNFAYGLAAIGTVSLLSTSSIAQSTDGVLEGVEVDVEDVELEAKQINYVGGFVGVTGDYLGSDDAKGGVAPLARIQIGKGARYAQLHATKLSVNVLDNKSWNLGPLLNYRGGRDDDVDDSVVSQMQEIDATVEVGAFVSWTRANSKDRRKRIGVSLSALQDVGDGHDGYLIGAGAKYSLPLSRNIVLSTGVSTTYGSGDYMDTYFGVDARDATVTGLSRFDADAGFRDVRLSLVGLFSFSAHWHLVGGVVYGRLLGDAEDSPVVDDRGTANIVVIGAGLAYAW